MVVSRGSERIGRILLRGVFLTGAMFLGGGAVQAQCADPGDVVGRCDLDGDGCIKNSGGCLKNNPGFEVDCNDGDFDPTNDCGGSGGSDPQGRFLAEMTEGTLRFDEGNVSFLLELPKGDRNPTWAYAETPVMFLRSVDPSGWDAIFGACPELFLPPSFLAFEAGKVDVQKAASVFQLHAGETVIEGLGGEPVELTFVLEGLNDETILLGTYGVEYQFETVNVFARSLAKGNRTRCRSGKMPLAPLGVIATSDPSAP